MRLGGRTWPSRYKATTGVGRVRLQALSEINHPCRPLRAFLLSPHLSLCFPELVCLFAPPPPLTLADGLCLLNTAPFITDTRFPSLCALHHLPSVRVSHTLCQIDLDFGSGCVILLTAFGLIKHRILLCFHSLKQLKVSPLYTAAIHVSYFIFYFLVKTHWYVWLTDGWFFVLLILP